MEELYRDVFNKVSRSVVVVENRNTGRYCIGSVASAEDNKTTFILMSSSFVGSSNQIFVHIDDNTVAEAKKIVTKDSFILLSIDYRADCTEVEFSQQDVDAPSDAVIIAPISMSSMTHIPAFVIQASCAARDGKMIDIEDSERYFLVSCHYGGLVSRGHHNQLISAPVFNLNGEAIGLVTSQCGTEKTKVDIKIGLLASSAKMTLSNLHEERKKPAQTTEESNHKKAAGTQSSAEPSKKKRKLRKLG